MSFWKLNSHWHQVGGVESEMTDDFSEYVTAEDQGRVRLITNKQTNIARIAKATQHKLLGKSSPVLSFLTASITLNGLMMTNSVSQSVPYVGRELLGQINSRSLKKNYFRQRGIAVPITSLVHFHFSTMYKMMWSLSDILPL